MSFERAWVLFTLPFPVLWMLWEWRREARRIPLALKTAMVIFIVLALAEPVLRIENRRVSLAVLADQSLSLSEADLAREKDLIAAAESARGSNLVTVIPFARTPRPSAPDKRGTNLEAPIREALASLPAETIHRILIVSDGNENEGSATRAAWQAQQLGVPIDALALAGRPRPQFQTQAVGFPGVVFTGERFPVDLAVESPRSTSATVELAAEGKSIGSHPVDLAPGENHVRIRASLNATGAIDLSGRIQTASLGESRFENALTVRRPKVVWVSSDPPGSESNIAAVLGANRFDLIQSQTLPEHLEDTQLVVLNNQNTDALRPAEKQRIEEFVSRGGGALWIAGENNIYVDKKGQPEDALEKTFPAKLAPPRSPEGTCVVLIIDKSSSMEGRKIELARAAASGVVDNLRAEDHVGVLMFDNSFQWAVPIRKADDKPAIKRQIAGIVPDGGTQIAPALNESYRRILPVQATYRHIVLLTDGISEEGDSLTLSKEAVANKVTISTVGLGQDVNRGYLEKVASTANGKSYFLNEPAGLEQILLRDVKEHTGTTAVEKPIRALLKHPSELLDKVPLSGAPTLDGYVRFESKPGADEILAIDESDADKKDPLLVTWQYGLGRAAVFTSDAKSRWAANWIGWPGFDTLWTNIFRDLLPRSSESEAVARYDAANQEIVVEYRMANAAAEIGTPPDLYALGPAGFRKPVELARVSSGLYRARVRIGALEGLFRVRPLNDSRAFPEVGLYRQESELSDYGSNDLLLRSLAQATGGRFNPAPSQWFDSGARAIESTLRLWPGLLAFALLLNLIELALRKLDLLSARKVPAAPQAADSQLESETVRA